MVCIGICQNEPNFLARIISATVSDCGFSVFYFDSEEIRVPKEESDTVAIVAVNKSYDSDVEFDLCVYESEFCKNLKGIRSNLAIIPDTCKTQPFHETNNIITYGLCRKNTVTVSSLVADDLVISVQREFPTLFGETVDAQEFHVKLPSIEDVDDTLALVTTLLALGVSPNVITNLSKS